MTLHTMDISQDVFDAINNGIKAFHLCKDKKFRIGDTVRFVCVDEHGDVVQIPDYKSNKNVDLRSMVAIRYIEYPEDMDEGLIPDKYCIIGFTRM